MAGYVVNDWVAFLQVGARVVVADAESVLGSQIVNSRLGHSVSVRVPGGQDGSVVAITRTETKRETTIDSFWVEYVGGKVRHEGFSVAYFRLAPVEVKQ
jgi:hypothetical protein